MNSVQLVGRLTRDPEVRYTDSGTSIARFSVAVDRRFSREGEQSADFISCVAFAKTGEFIEKYFHKGMKIGLVGRIQTGSYEKDGTKYYTTDVIAETVEFVESKNSSSEGDSAPAQPAQQKPKAGSAADGFMNLPDVIDEELPFA